MGQAMASYLYIFIFPAIAGIVVRLICGGKKRAYLVTVGFAVLTAAIWAAANILPTHGNEFLALLTVQAASAAFAAMLTGFVIRIKYRK